MNRDEFCEHLKRGEPATHAVARITGTAPEMVTVADTEDDEHGLYVRYAVMMAGDLMAAITIISLDTRRIPYLMMDRIRNGEPAGAVLSGMFRKGWAMPYSVAVRSSAYLFRDGDQIGYVEEIFTQSLFE